MTPFRVLATSLRGLLLGVVASSCGCSRPLSRAAIAEPVDPWHIETTAPNGPVYLGNSTYGIQVPALGVAAAGDSFALVNSRLIRVASPSVGSPPKDATEFWGRLDMHCGVYRTAWTSGGKRVRIETEVDPEFPVVVQRIWGDVSLCKPFGYRVLSRVGEGFAERICILEQPATRRPDYASLSFDWVGARLHRWLGGRSDIHIDGPAEDERAIRSFLYYMHISRNPVLPPFGLSSAQYGGHRFWDAEAWMLPVYGLTDPEEARVATIWRAENLTNDRIVWETGPGGEDNTAPEFKQALHQAGWVAWWANRASALDLAHPRPRELAQAAYEQFRRRGRLTARGIEFLGVESPDEGRLRNNDLVTNLLAKTSAKAVQFLSPTQSEEHGKYKESLQRWADKIVIPKRPDGIPATYDNDPLIRYQQAAALLALYPLEWPLDEATQIAMFDRYKDKASDAGPAMSDSVHATIAARLGRADEAYRLWNRSWRPFVRPGTLQFCERRNLRDSYFVTGAAGCLQTVIYGFLGVRISLKGVPGAPSKRLHNGYVLSVKPNLPPQWKSITLRNIRILGEIYTIHATHDKAVITHGGN